MTRKIEEAGGEGTGAGAGMVNGAGPSADALRIVVLADKGGVGKTFVAALVWSLFEEGGRTLRIGEAERPTERKMTELLKKAEVPAPEPSVELPSEQDLAGNSRLKAAAFGPLLQAMRANRDTLIDVAAGGTRGLLDQAEIASHGERTDGGRGMVFLVVAKAEDITSALSAEAAAAKARSIYPNAKVVIVITHVTHDRQRKTNNAASVADKLRQTASDVVLIDYNGGPLVGELYGSRNVAFHDIAAMSIDDVADLLGVAGAPVDEDEAAIFLGEYLLWYFASLRDLANKLDVPAPAARRPGAAAPHPTVAAGRAA